MSNVTYGERYRPQFHFTPRRGWNNDPNGMVYYAGEWHMYYQYNPFGVQWGNMHWGHAVSRDLVHWQELPLALYQRSLRDMAFSGGGLVDWGNSAGFQQGSQPPLVVAFTSTGRGECLAYSNDNGRTLREWEGNPFLVHTGRDPKITWFEKTQRWVLIIYEELDNGERGYAFYDSPDLKRWTRRSFLSGYFECPELFQLALDGDTKDLRWVIHGCKWEQSRSTCLVGQFDGQTFTAEAENLHAHYGPRYYAAQAFSDAPDGRVIMVGWLSGADYPGMPFSGGMTVPHELSLRRTANSMRLCFNPVKELEGLRQESVAAGPLTVTEANALLARADSELLDVELRLHARGPMAFAIREYPLLYDPAAGKLAFDEQTAPLTGGESLELRLLIDRSITEVFANQGEAALSSMTLFETPRRPFQIEGDALVEEIKIHRLARIW